MGTVELAYDLHECKETLSHLNPIIMMHGISWNKFVLRDIAKDLCQVTKRKIYFLDLRNHGESPSTDDCSITLMIEDVKRFIQEQNLRKFAFACHSFSNTIAYMIALEKPESVEKMLMIDNPPFNDFNEYFNNTSVYPQQLIQERLLKTLDSKLTLREAKAKLQTLAQMSKPGQYAFYKKVAHDLTKENGKFKWRYDFDFLKERYEGGHLNLKGRGSSEIEILIIRCENSGRVPDSKFEAVLKYNPNARLMTFENTTHLLMFEEREKFLQAAKEFLHVSE